MNKERFFIEINDENSVYDGKTLKVTVPKDKQSCEGVDFYFSQEYAENHNLVIESISMSPAPLYCYWNWLMTPGGAPDYEIPAPNGYVDVSKYQIAGIPGAFGFSGHTNDTRDIEITFNIKQNDSTETE